MSVLQGLHWTAILVPMGSLPASCAVFTRTGYFAGRSSPNDVAVIEKGANVPMAAAIKALSFI
jgi:hypothetical protein